MVCWRKGHDPLEGHGSDSKMSWNEIWKTSILNLWPGLLSQKIVPAGDPGSMLFAFMIQFQNWRNYTKEDRSANDVKYGSDVLSFVTNACQQQWLFIKKLLVITVAVPAILLQWLVAVVVVVAAVVVAKSDYPHAKIIGCLKLGPVIIIKFVQKVCYYSHYYYYTWK